MFSDSRCRSTARLSSFQAWAVPVLLAAMAGSAGSQTVAPATPAAESAPSERVKRDAEKVFHWIRMHADKPRKVLTQDKPAAAPVRTSSRPAPRAEPGSGDAAPVPPLPSAPTAAIGRSGEGSLLDPSAPAPGVSTAAVSPAASAASGELPRTDAGPAVPSAAAPAAAPAVEDDDEQLTPIVQTEPQFPASLMRQLRRGLVQVSFTVEPDGSVSNAKAMSTTHPRLTQSALATIAQWKFQPVKHAQQGVVDLGFNLD